MFRPGRLSTCSTPPSGPRCHYVRSWGIIRPSRRGRLLAQRYPSTTASPASFIAYLTSIHFLLERGAATMYGSHHLRFQVPEVTNDIPGLLLHTKNSPQFWQIRVPPPHYPPDCYNYLPRLSGEECVSAGRGWVRDTLRNIGLRHISVLSCYN